MISYCTTTRTRNLLALLLLAATLAPSPVRAFRPSVTGKKLIASGWHMPPIAEVRQRIGDLEQLPFDGIIVGSFHPFWQGFRDQQAALEAFTADARATAFRRFTDNFIGVESGNDGGFDWFDEARCAELARNLGLLAKAAREAGFRGLKLDPECYEGPSPFEYSQARRRDSVSVAQYTARVEQVGAQVMRAINAEYPDLTILLYFGPSCAGNRADLTGWCGLLPAFVDGMLREARPGLVVVDGYEQAYGFRRPDQYADGRQAMKQIAKRASSVPDRFGRHVQAGFAVWPDNWHGSPRIGRRSFRPDDLSRNYYLPDELAYALHSALAYSDRYVWVWAESLDLWNRRAMVYDDAGEMTWLPVPDAFLAALTGGRAEEVPAVPWRDSSAATRAVTAKDLGPVDDQTVFGDLWAEHRFLADLPVEWRFATDPDNQGVKRGWAKQRLDDRTWSTLRIGALWDEQGYGGWTGYAWYRLGWSPPALPEGQRLFLAFGAVDESAWVYVNGKLCGVHDINPHVGYKERFLVEVTDQLKPGTTNLIAVRVGNQHGVGGIWRTVKLVAR
ncbi:MAG: hypothetical protein WDA75_06730 [Candidatus Latescibacterota bacterium]|jgi:hypothetical protein